jgi:hypothetical protein
MSDQPVKPRPELMQRRRRQMRRAAWIATAIAILLACVLAVAGPSAWAALSRLLASLKPAIVVLHLILIGALFWRWGRTVAWLYRRGWIHPDNLPLALSMRNRVTGLLLALEVLVVMRLPFAWL